ncbi:MAG: NAD(P)-dependent oxidoreductase [Erysipelotrichaceae bacterium]|nr:NAD(P)-dependent oxidoreductase [Erysipelotrichaceae bacterium]MDY5252275.1 NAD(P)-dependent oxidoreductase [Erysipelotrichaceae bacterium]
MKIGFIGTGVMGQGMIKNLIKNGHSVKVYNRTYAKAKALEAFGAIVTEDIAHCVEDVEIVISIVGMPKDVEEVYQLIFKHFKGHLAIDMTTSSPTLARALANQAKAHNIKLLDAPVSGGDVGAANGTLSIMVGGEKEAFMQARPIFEAMGKTINYIGPAGSGQHCKMANQIAIAGCIASVSEALNYAATMGLDQQVVFDAIAQGAAGSWQMSNNGQKMINKDFAPGFFIKHFIKDMKLAQAEAQQQKLDLTILKDVLAAYEKLVEEYSDELGTQAIYQLYAHKK